MNRLSIDWKIQKRLLDAGGLGPVVYILRPRTNSCMSRARMRELELRVRGRTVIYVQPQEPKNLLGSRKPWVVRDRDILTPEGYERAERIWNEFWKERKSQ